MNTERGNAVAWLALVVGIVALILAWSAYNRAGQDLEEQIDQQVDEVIENVDNDAAVGEVNLEIEGDATDTATGTTTTE